MSFFCATIEGPVVLMVIILGVWIWNLFERLSETWNAKKQSDRLCKHGVRGGEMNDLCRQCSEEKRAEREQWECQKREKERLAAIRTTALELRSKEHRRLTEVRLHQRDYLLGISPDDFEVAVVRLFKKMGFDAEKSPPSNDRGRDAVLTKDGRTDLVQCKRYAVENLVGRPAMQQFLGTIQSEKADGGYFVTTSGYSKGAIEVAEAHGIHLIDGKKLCKMMLSHFGDAGAKTYRTMCVMCGEEVAFDLDSGETVKACSNGHPVNLDFDQHIFRMNLDGTAPMCPRCGNSVRVINGRRGKFFGCLGYPDCRFTAEYSPHSATAQSGGGGSEYREPEEPIYNKPIPPPATPTSPVKKHPAEDFLRETREERALQSARMPEMISMPSIGREKSQTPEPQPNESSRSIMESEIPADQPFLQTFEEAAADGDAQASEWLERCLYPSQASMLSLQATPQELESDSTPNESVPLQWTRKEMLSLCVESWLESDPPPELDQDVSLRFGSAEQFPKHPKGRDSQEWEIWLETILNRFPLDSEDVDRFREVRAEDPKDKHLLKEVATGLIASHLAPDPL